MDKTSSDSLVTCEAVPFAKNGRRLADVAGALPKSWVKGWVVKLQL